MVEIIDGRVSYSDSECIHLDLKVVSILGFEMRKSCWDIERIVKGIEEGAEFPPVFLVPVGKPEELKYVLTSVIDHHERTNCGGHHRAVAHYLANKPMKCIILEPYLAPVTKENLNLFYSPIEDTILG